MIVGVISVRLLVCVSISPENVLTAPMTGGDEVIVAVNGGSKMGTDDQRVRALLTVLFIYWIELNLISLSSLVGAVDAIV